MPADDDYESTVKTRAPEEVARFGGPRRGAVAHIQHALHVNPALVPLFVLAAPWLLLSLTLCFDGLDEGGLSNQVGCAGLVFVAG